MQSSREESHRSRRDSHFGLCNILLDFRGAVSYSHRVYERVMIVHFERRICGSNLVGPGLLADNGFRPVVQGELGGCIVAGSETRKAAWCLSSHAGSLSVRKTRKVSPRPPVVSSNCFVPYGTSLCKPLATCSLPVSLTCAYLSCVTKVMDSLEDASHIVQITASAWL